MIETMRLPRPLLRLDPRLSKKDFGHVLIIAGSPSMLGAAALAAAAASRSGAGLVTCAIPKSLNLALQKKIPSVVMTLGLAQTSDGCFSSLAFKQLQLIWPKFNAVAIGPGLGRAVQTMSFARQVIRDCPHPLVVDADALFALSGHLDVLHRSKGPRILTPHTGEFSRLTRESVGQIGSHRRQSVHSFTQRWPSVLLLKGPRTLIAEKSKVYINSTGNAGLAKGGSGDVLTGMIAAFCGQGLSPLEAAVWGARLHGTAADLAVRRIPRVSLIASDLIDKIPGAINRYA